MEYISVKTAAEKWKVTERSVRNYCALGKIPGTFLVGKTWSIPADAEKPGRVSKKAALPDDLLGRLRTEKQARLTGGIYHKIQIDLTYNSNHIEGSCLTHDQTRYIYETNTIGVSADSVRVDDILETANHFRCIDMVIDHAGYQLSESFIKELHRVLKNGTEDSRKGWFAVGDYKRIANEVGGLETTPPSKVPEAMQELLHEYNTTKEKSFDDILEFHYRFERIHPFQDGNGRVGRLIMFHECLRSGIAPFIIDDGHKMYYYRGLKEWRNTPGYLRDTCLLMQDNFKAVMDYFGVRYSDAE